MAKHLAGIIPLANFDDTFKLPYDSFMLPIQNDFTLIQKSVFECAMAGCSTIWIVANDDMTPLIRHRLGEWVQDPVWIGRSMDPYPSQTRKRIPIYYVPVRAKDIGKRDCLAWSVLHGAVTAFEVSARLSKWIIPKRNYVAFPYGIYDPEILREHRKNISLDKPFMLSYNI